MTSIIVAGSRHFIDRDFLFGELDKIVSNIKGDVEIVSGHCRGADVLGEEYAKAHGLASKIFLADWDAYGKSAGYIRNKRMAEYAAEHSGILVAFPLGQSKGTALMIRLAKGNGLTCFICTQENRTCSSLRGKDDSSSGEIEMRWSVGET